MDDAEGNVDLPFYGGLVVSVLAWKRGKAMRKMACLITCEMLSRVKRDVYHWSYGWWCEVGTLYAHTGYVREYESFNTGTSCTLVSTCQWRQ